MLSFTKQLALGFLGCAAVIGCRTPKAETNNRADQAPISTIAFGSCSDQKRPQPLWDDIVAQKPNVWIWLGDNVYGDTENMDTLKAKYDRQKANPVYQQLRQSASIIGVWDDHDYGVNDGGKEYPRRKESQQLMLDFLDVPASDPLRKQEGAYSAHVYGPAGKRVKVILLDGRYFRDPLKKEGKLNVPDPSGDLLGEAQWTWLEKQLTNSDADVHLIGCGIQFLPEEHPYEKWGNFPVARQRFLDLLAKTKPKGALLLSGDRHIAEVSRVRVPGLGYDLFDITSSGLTHVSKPHEEPNRHRVGEMVAKLNYGLITINWEAKPLTATVRINGDGQATHLTQTVSF
ncbi:alkaline phosphatase D family protein [Spirosoma sordidisoli]|uniref:Alkaline phosphatase family protein n=1 Tax=Spirosoma sordidisoli TaxID=2502893 RepID=A0A4Q2UE11_9BACT|nr:alkaline phosphatase D family protein [Spirosoma sordidisoli]RYC67076.1 alkaline phosphatase family protein [Spirosoma sordidisoli]RYC67204.1 alkaline phosphatase family protein [Spirosoma sordidisoli]